MNSNCTNVKIVKRNITDTAPLAMSYSLPNLICPIKITCPDISKDFLVSSYSNLCSSGNEPYYTALSGIAYYFA